MDLLDIIFISSILSLLIITICNMTNTSYQVICFLMILNCFIIISLLIKPNNYKITEHMTNRRNNFKDLHNPIKKANCNVGEDYTLKDCITCDNSCLQ